MTEPVTQVKDEICHETKKKVQGIKVENFKLDPKSFDWFLDGIDKKKLEALQEKLELTFVRQNEPTEMQQRFDMMKIDERTQS